MKTISIKDDDDVELARDEMDFNEIINRLDQAGNRNICLVAYLYALRDLQYANNQIAYSSDAATLEAIKTAEFQVARSFGGLVKAQRALFRY